MENDRTQKLFTFKDVSGNEQYDAIEYANDFFKFIKEKHPSVVAVQIVGSTGKGYAKDKENPSDIDVCIILQDEKAQNAEGASAAALKIESDDVSQFNSMDKKHRIEFHGVINATNLSENVNRIKKSPEKCIAGLLYPYVGDVNAVNRIIGKVSNIVKTIEKPENWAIRFAERIVDTESLATSLDRRLEALGTLANHEKEQYEKLYHEYKNQRINLYYKRIKKLFLDEK